MSLYTKNRVLVPIDFSEMSFQAVEEAMEFVEYPSNLHILHVLPDLSPVEPGVMWNTIDNDIRKENVRKAFYNRYTDPEYQRVHFAVMIGDASSEIIDYAQDHEIELIIISSHGRTGFNRFLMGSVAEKVIRHAHCPVLVLRN
jgi:nucleotide-binding universal stress UspA family protein